MVRFPGNNTQLQPLNFKGHTLLNDFSQLAPAGSPATPKAV
jgi:hypothetical protein